MILTIGSLDLLFDKENRETFRFQKRKGQKGMDRLLGGKRKKKKQFA
jgi:hypothetical protein